jgi:WD40 repeat protein
VGWSPDGRWIASGSGGEGGGELFLWDVEVERAVRVRTFAGHPSQVSALAWTPSGKQLISEGGDGIVRWWDVERAACVKMREEAHQGVIHALKISPDGKRLASCGDDGAIRIWDLSSREHLQTLQHDRPYERLNITGIRGLTEAQKSTLRSLGAIDDSYV